MASEGTEIGTLLIVDDNPTNLELLLDTLKDSGFKVLVAKDGPGTFQRLEHALPDLILLDVLMPGMDGFEVCRKLKENRITRDIPVIFMTSLDDTNNKIRGFQVGAVDYITKPFQQEEVMARITTHLTLRRLQQHLRQKNAELARANAELEERNQELDTFAQTVAHELKNPLGLVMGFAEVIAKEGGLPEDLRNLLEVIAKSGRKMRSIINELLLLAGMRKVEVEHGPLDMHSIIGEAQIQLSQMIAESQAEISLPEEWPAALGHAPWIEEVWVNYLSNGIKYGGKPPRLRLGATPVDGMVRFWVRDNGPGLVPAEQSRLFIEFTQLSQVQIRGHGLGLSIVRRIVEKLGGQVGVESTGVPGEGCTFFFTLPQPDKSL
jgi:signal transduction histidine kinase